MKKKINIPVVTMQLAITSIATICVGLVSCVTLIKVVAK